MALLRFAMHHAAVLGLIAATAWAASQVGMRLLGLRDRDVPLAVTIAIGLAILAQCGLLLGLVGWLRAPALVVMVAGLHAAAFKDWQRLAAWRPGAGRGASRQVSSRPRRAPIAIAIGVVGVPLFLLTLYPPLGFDQTLYHLPASRAFATTGDVPFLPELRYPVFPQLAEVLNAEVLIGAGDVATQLVGGLALAACLGLIFVWTRELSSAAGGWIAAATLAGSPIAFYLAATGYVEPLLALWGLASLYAASRGRQESSLGWILTSGFMAGTAAGAKYLGLFYVPAACVLLISSVSWRITLRHLVACLLAAAVALAPTYGRILAHTGNPLFPFFPDVFGSSPWAADELLGARGVARLRGASTLLWDMTFRRHDVGALPPFSPLFVAGVPIALIGAWRQPTLRRLVLLAVGYVLLAPVHAHYFLGVAPVWSVAIGAGAATLVDRHSLTRRVTLLVALTLGLGGGSYVIYRAHRLGPPPATPADRARLLEAELPLYAAVAFVNSVTASTSTRPIVYAVNAENMVEYTTVRLIGDVNGPASYSRMENRVRARGTLAAALDEIGASYVIVPAQPSEWATWAERDARLDRVYRDTRANVYRVVAAAAVTIK